MFEEGGQDSVPVSGRWRTAAAVRRAAESLHFLFHPRQYANHRIDAQSGKLCVVWECTRPDRSVTILFHNFTVDSKNQRRASEPGTHGGDEANRDALPKHAGSHSQPNGIDGRRDRGVICRYYVELDHELLITFFLALMRTR